MQESQDLIDEMEEFHALLTTLSEKDWNTPTLFMDWTPWDVVAHLHYFDLVSMAALEGEESFAATQKELMDSIVSGRTNAEIARERFGDMNATELLAAWRRDCVDMATQLGASEPKRRLPWFGPDMGVRMFTTARFMETWSHSQEVYDLKGVKRTYNDRIKNVAAIGIRTFGWTFVNRKMEIPGPPPYVRITAPSGEIWEWNDPSEDEYVRGDAAEFCHVVTQGRNISDTNLEVAGDVATQWMAIAQCFAGGPVDPPAPGARKG
jgi:uncharacterized protein (TIGR03084 family)